MTAMPDSTSPDRPPDQGGRGDGALYEARELRRSGDLESAERAFAAAVEQGSGAAAFDLGVLLLEQDRESEAEAAFRRADELGVPDGLSNVGVILEARGDKEGAEAAWRRARENGSALAALNLGALLEARGDIPGARAVYADGGSQGAEHVARIDGRRRRTLAKDARGGDVRLLQEWLRELGFRARVDGFYGPETTEAVRSLQSRGGLPSDGIVGPATWSVVELTPSVRGAMERLTGEVTAATLTSEILVNHGEYGDKQGGSLALDREAGARRTTVEWLRRVRAELDPITVPRLHGRVVIAGLARVDEDLHRQLTAAGFLQALEAEIHPPLTPPPPSPGALAGYVTDAVRAGQRLEDRLGVEGEANALAGVLIARDVRPPLSVGLFGDWGTGKSFFMGLMQQRIETLTKETRDRPDEQSAYYGHVRQIAFNAWHYADANLWASLITRVFEGLAESGEDRSKLIGALETNKRQRNLAEAQVEAARANREQAEQKLVAVQQRRDAASHQASDSSRGTLEQVAADPDVLEATDQIGDVLSQDAAKATKEIIQTAGALERLWTRKRILWRELRHRYGVLLYAGFATAAVVLAGLMTLSLTKPEWLAAIVAFLGTAAKVLSGPAKSVRQAEKIVNGSLDKAQDRIKAEEDAAKREHASAAAAEQHAHAQLQEIDSGRQLLTFIAQRAGASEYQAQLGLIAAVREDFERLTALLGEGSNGELPAIERVVLYIDDLDRCPADRVVEVLEAVHLLLAFELFVVVVGVDSRWLLNSLRRHYAAQLADEGGNGEDAAHWASTPQNYLEKIFQIPYVLRGMDDAGFGRLVADLLRSPDDGTPPNGNPAERREPARDAPPPDPSPERAVAAPADPAPEEPGGDTLVHPTPPAPDAAPAIELRPQALRFTRDEIEYLSGLRALVATPRAAKRLANTYRLVRAGLGERRLERFTGEDGGPGQYREVQLLLTSLAHSSSVGGRLLDEIAAQPEDATWAALIARLKDADDDPAWTRFIGCLEAIVSADRVEPSVRQLKAWAPKVARFSFVAGMPRVT